MACGACAVVAGLVVLFITLYFWPLVLAVSVWLDHGVAAARLEATGVLGRLSIQLRLAPERSVVAELNVLHLATLRRSMTNGPPGSGKASGLGLNGRAALDWLADRLRVEEVSIFARLGLGDAAWTAQAYGLLWAAVAAAWTWLRVRLDVTRPPRIDVSADFRGCGAAFHAVLRTRVAQGDAVVALARAWFQRRPAAHNVSQ
ncbi:MAG: hypothetical protein BAA04_02960 [Firmicutes bacterium ZCTH02-B6]|nr:MAG: hypothetical protein BAA04_02960 [Firmicutes bacterium ZCTH02-B6]